MKNKNKRILKTGSVLSVAGIAAIGLSSCGSSLTYESSVQLIVSDNTSTLADKSFSENTYDGICDFMNWACGATLPDASTVNENSGLWKRPGTDDSSRLEAYKNAVDNGSDIIVATGYNQQDALEQATSTDSTYSTWKSELSDTAFVFVDGSMETSYDGINSDPSNVASVAYRADDGSFLAGIATAVFLNEYQSYFAVGIDKDKLGVSSFVGLALPSTLSYMNGFRMGIDYWNTVLQPLITTVDGSTATMKITWIDPTGANSPSMDNYVSGSFSAGEASATTLSTNMRSHGANAIFPIAGPQTSDVMDEIANDTAGDGSKTARSIVLGVDTAQEDDTSLQTKLNNGSNDSSIGNGQILQFSSIKNLEHSTDGILKAIVTGQNTSDSLGYDDTDNQVNTSSDSKSNDTWYGMGWNNVGTLNNASVGVSDAGLKYVIDPYFWVSSASTITSDSLSTWSNTDLTYGKVTLDELIGDKTYSAQALSTTDSVISKYANLLDGSITTPTSVTADDSSSTVVNLGVSSSSDTNFSTNGLNGALGDGSWKIYNNTTDSSGNSVNNFLTISLSSYLPGISGTSSNVATYQVADNTPSYVAKTATTIDITQSDIHYKKN